MKTMMERETYRYERLPLVAEKNLDVKSGREKRRERRQKQRKRTPKY